MDRERDARPATLGEQAKNGACEQRATSWNECGLEEKIERVRRELLRTRDVAELAARNANEGQRIASTHVHTELGHVAIPVHETRQGYEAGSIARYDPLR